MGVEEPRRRCAKEVLEKYNLNTHTAGCLYATLEPVCAGTSRGGAREAGA
jgi:hypothetical protein